MTDACFAIEIGGTKLLLAVGQPDGTILEKLRFSVDPARGGAGIRRQIEDAFARLGSRFRPIAAAVGFGGPIDRESGRVKRSHQIEGWAGFDLRGWLTGLARAPVVVENDANTAALAEATRGAGRGFDPVFYMTLGSGIGGGLVRGGKIYHGASPGESEIGHVRLDAQGTTLEGKCSGWAVDRRIRQECTSHPESVLTRLVGESPGQEARHLATALAQGDAWARDILGSTLRDLALGVSHVVHLFHPQVIVLGGGLSLLGDPLREGLSAALPGLVMEVFRDTLDIRTASLGEDAVPLGALLLAGGALGR